MAIAEQSAAPARTAAGRPAAPAAIEVDRLDLLTLLWALAILFHQSKAGSLTDGRWHHAILTIAAARVLLRPGDLRGFAALLACQVASVAIDLPVASNHWVFVFVTSIAMLLVLAGQFVRGRGRVDRAEFLGVVLPMLRLEVVLLYAFVTLAKLNWDFLDPDLSVGAEMYRWLTIRLPLLPSGRLASEAAIHATLAIEGFLPVLLAVRRTRMAGLALGWAFHLLLGFNGYHDFSSVMFAFYVAFLPDDFVARLSRGLERYPRLAAALGRLGAPARSPSTFAMLAVLALAAAFAQRLGLGNGSLINGVANIYLRGAWLLTSLLLPIPVLLALREDRADADDRGRSVRQAGPGLGAVRALAMAGPLLVVFNGLNPYLGLRTESVFIMYSNLQTEGDRWNHCLLPAWIRAFPFQDDLVTVVRCSEGEMLAQTLQGARWVYLGFVDYASKHPEMSVSYEYRGVYREVARVADDPELSAGVSPWVRKLLYFRPVMPPERLADYSRPAHWKSIGQWSP